MKKIENLLLVICIAIIASGCGKSEVCSISSCDNQVYKDGLCPDHYVEANSSSNSEKMEKEEDVIEEKNGNSKEITLDVAKIVSMSEIGLKNIKLDSSLWKLTPEQELLVRYFDKDYFYGQYYFIRKYPQLFDGMQVETNASIAKIISQDNESYELLAGWNWFYHEEWALGDTPYENNSYECADIERVKEELVLVKGKTKNQYFMEKENLSIRGRFSGVETVTVDGVSYTVPVLNAYSENEVFSYEEIKAISEQIFGNQISVSTHMLEYTDMETGENGYMPMDGVYEITLDNQKNAKFSKYIIYDNAAGLYDIDYFDSSKPQKHIEFAPDFEHFFLFIHDSSVNNLTIEYYDKDLNQLWKREFLDTTTANYDYTSSNAYIVVNGYLYILDMETGENVTEKKYVGQKTELRKTTKGIILFAKGKSESIMMTDNDGNIVWSINTDKALNKVYRTQFIEDVMTISYDAYDNQVYDDYYDGDFETRYDGFIQVDIGSGELLLEVEEVSGVD